MKKTLIAIFISFLVLTAYAQETSEEQNSSINKPSCLSICGKQFFRNLDDNRKVLFGNSNTALPDEAKATIEGILKTLSEKGIRQKAMIVITSYTDNGNTKVIKNEAIQHAQAIKRYFILYGFEEKHINTQIKPYVKCTQTLSECAQYSRKVNINIKGLL